AVLEKDRTLTAETLQNYLPIEGKSNMLMRIAPENKDDFSERDILYKVLFDMKKDMGELKKLVLKILQSGISSTNFDDHTPYINQLYRDIDLTGDEHQSAPTRTIHQPTDELEKEDISGAEEVEESLSLIDPESDLIKKAL